VVEKQVVEIGQDLKEHREEWRAVNAEQKKNEHEKAIAAGQPFFDFDHAE